MLLDVVILAYCLYGAARGWKRKASWVFYRLARLLLAFGSGLGLFKWAGGMLAFWLPPVVANVLGFGLTFGLPFAALRVFRRQMTAWLERRTTEHRMRVWGAVAGGFHSFILASTVLILAQVAHPGSLGAAAGGSLLGRAYTFLLGGP